MALTIAQLAQRALRNRPHGISTDVGRFRILKILPIRIAQIVALQARFKPLSATTQPYYDTLIVFQDVKFSDARTRTHTLQVPLTRRTTAWVVRPSFTNTSVKVSCTCPDYYWTWWWYNSTSKNTHAADDFTKPKGKRLTAIDPKTKRRYYPPPSKRVPYGTIPGSRNDKRVPGVCKHILALANQLIREKVIKR
jgi:hypothetical protein